MQNPILLVGNWKMNPVTEKQAIALAKSYKGLDVPKQIEIACAVPFPFVQSVTKTLGKSKIRVGIQNIHPEKSGAHTGEVSFPMIASWKVSYVLVGHSERRAMGETDAFINQKVLAALKHGVTPILCVGEKLRDEHGFFLRTVEEQLKAALTGVSKQMISRVVIAYEPLWAIGKDATREATAEECREMVIFIKKAVSDSLGDRPKILPKILYGGSVNELNAHEFIEAGADGLLPGRLSLEPKKMQKLIRSLSAISTSSK